MARPAQCLAVLRGLLAVGSRRDHRDASAVGYVLADLVRIVGLVGKDEVVADMANERIQSADTVVLVAGNKTDGQSEPDAVHRRRNLGVPPALGPSKPLILSGKRMPGRVLVGLHLRGVQSDRNREVAVLLRQLPDRPIPKPAPVPSAVASPDAVVFAEVRRHLIPHRSGAEYPPDSIEDRIEVAIRAASTAAHRLAVLVVNFFSSSRICEGISSALCFITENLIHLLHPIASQLLEDLLILSALPNLLSG